MKSVVIDTDIFIDHFRNYGPATNLLEKLSIENTRVFVSVLTIAEIMSGKDCVDVGIRSQIEDFFAPMEKVDVNLDISKKGAEFRRVYGTPLVDSIIGATAFHLSSIVYTRNTRHFSKIREIDVKGPY